MFRQGREMIRSVQFSFIPFPQTLGWLPREGDIKFYTVLPIHKRRMEKETYVSMTVNGLVASHMMWPTTSLYADAVACTGCSILLGVGAHVVDGNLAPRAGVAVAVWVGVWGGSWDAGLVSPHRQLRDSRDSALRRAHTGANTSAIERTNTTRARAHTHAYTHTAMRAR